MKEALIRALEGPTPAKLRRLRGDLLEAGLPGEAGSWPLLAAFHGFLDRLVTGTSSREYSELASKLDVAAVSGVVMEEVLQGRDGEDLGRRLLSGLLSEGLMVLATRQHVKAWAGELDAVYREAAWFLYGEMWDWARSKKPDLPEPQRRLLLDRLFAPVHDGETEGFARAVLLGQVFQLLLIARVTEDLAAL